MPWYPDLATGNSVPPRARWGDTFCRWNRRLHYYLGLYLLGFVWLFAFTGLLLNHSQWRFAEFWDSRKDTSADREIAPPPPGGDLAQARDLMRQLGIQGEIEWTVTRAAPDSLQFRASRPGQIIEVNADFARHKATVKRIDLNAWGVMRLLHTFSGVRLDDNRNRRDWVLTSLWAWSMDGVAVGLVLMVVSSLFMWYERPQKRKLGIIVLALGFLSCGWFSVGLGWLY
ncbi:MAG: PepSY-associated TM helix domain-containing protein [Verrucomicrobia bacterium]|nr:PepSY-associated TM helix domain-containing protein [Verrucomicrobiota bacterium]